MKKKLRVDIGELSVPVDVYIERRNSVRASIGKRAVNFRFPYGLSESERTEHWNRLIKWLEKNKATLAQRFAEKQYVSGDTLVVGKREYTLQIEETTNKSHSGKLEKPNVIRLRINSTDDNYKGAIQTLLSRIVGQDFLPEMDKRVRELNDMHFNVSFANVRLKYNVSNWGSCSSKGNLNFSTRLLFAPDDVVDYVIIHELAHRIEMNHSPKFWKLVEDAMPDYKQKEEWLKVNGASCTF